MRLFTINYMFVYVFYLSDGEGVKLQDELNATGPGECYYVKCDLTIEEDVQVCTHAIIKK